VNIEGSELFLSSGFSIKGSESLMPRNQIVFLVVLLAITILFLSLYNNNWHKSNSNIEITHEYYADGRVKSTHVLSLIDSMLCIQDQYEIGVISRKICIDKSGLSQGPFEYYYNNGNIRAIGETLNNLPNGLIKTYYKNGNLKDSVHYRNGLNHGSLHLYNTEGQLQAVNYFFADSLIHKRIYSYSGNGDIEFFETFNPIIKLSADTVSLNEKMEVLFELPIDEA